MTHFSTHTRDYIYFCEVKEKKKGHGCNISVNYIDLDVAVDSPDWSVEASEEVDQSTSSVRVRQQSHVVVLCWLRTA